ncbi:MAG: sugar ABC transporter ATP-binding protein [Chloroflexi bacterium]|nr:sugar ABC transporter ATP-binding protein [Chloroflexota bacterium]
MPDTPLLQVTGVSKRFGGVQALDQVDFQVRAGEVHVLLGENGAGKSTLVKIITGVESPDCGSILLNGQAVHLASPADAQGQGISVIHQEFSLLPNLTVGQNLYLGREPRAGWRVDWPLLYQKAQKDLAALELALDPRAPLSTLSVGEQQMVAVARALSMSARLLILDEPTAALNERETDCLFEMLNRLRDSGVGIVYISHRLQEISRIGDRATVLRDGRLVGTVPVASTLLPELIRMMVGRMLDEPRARVQRQADHPVLEIRHLTLPGAFEDVSLVVRGGEVVGLAGLMGAGQEAFARSVFGLGARPQGEVRLFGRVVNPRSPIDAIRNSVAFLPADRKRSGLCLLLSLRENVVHPVLTRRFPHGFLTAGRERRIAKPLLKDLRVVCHSVDQSVGQLSGGNQQKVALAKWMSTKAKLYVLMEPTRGVDVATKAEIHSLIDRMAAEGAAILVVTSDLPELTGLSDRIYVFRQGRIVSELSKEEISQERVLNLAAAGGAGHAV